MNCGHDHDEARRAMEGLTLAIALSWICILAFGWIILFMWGVL